MDTFFYDRQSSKGNDSKCMNARVIVLALRLMLNDIYMKFLEGILNRFQVTERTRFCDGQSTKGSHSKSEDSLNGFQVIERTLFCDRVQGKYLKKYKCKSYGSCALHVV